MTDNDERRTRHANSGRGLDPRLFDKIDTPSIFILFQPLLPPAGTDKNARLHNHEFSLSTAVFSLALFCRLASVFYDNGVFRSTHFSHLPTSLFFFFFSNATHKTASS